MNTITFGLFLTQESAENAIDELSRNGFLLKDIEVIIKDKKTGAYEVGELLGGLIKLGLAHEEALIYEKDIETGGILLGVPFADHSVETIQQIFEKHKASQVRVVNRNSQ